MFYIKYFNGSCLMTFERIFKHVVGTIIASSLTSIIYCLAKIFTDSSVQLFETRRFQVSCNAM